MKKTALILIVLTLLSALFTGCSGKKRCFKVPDPMPRAVVLGYQNTLAKKYTPVSEGRIPVFKEEDALFDGSTGSLSLGFDYTHTQKHDQSPASTVLIVASFPSARIVERDDGMLILTYDIDSGYRVFYLIPPENEYLVATGTPFVVKDAHSYKEFSKLKIGDDISKVEAIDSVASLFMKYIRRQSDTVRFHLLFNSPGEQYNAPMSTVHYLTDGILKIEYKMLDDDATVVITNIIYNKDRILPDPEGNPIDYTVSEDDLPF